MDLILDFILRSPIQDYEAESLQIQTSMLANLQRFNPRYEAGWTQYVVWSNFGPNSVQQKVNLIKT